MSRALQARPAKFGCLNRNKYIDLTQEGDDDDPEPWNQHITVHEGKKKNQGERKREGKLKIKMGQEKIASESGSTDAVQMPDISLEQLDSSILFLGSPLIPKWRADQVDQTTVDPAQLNLHAASAMNGQRLRPIIETAAGPDAPDVIKKSWDEFKTRLDALSKPFDPFPEIDPEFIMPTTDPDVVMPLLEIYPDRPSIGSATERADGDWVEHEFTVDTRACDHVTNPAELTAIPIVKGEKACNKVKYEVANGEEVDNLGERRAILATEGSMAALHVTLQVCDVHKSLLSVGKIVGAAKRSIFDAEASGGSYIEDKVTGEKLPLRKQGNIWTLSAWVKKAPSGAQWLDPSQQSRRPFGRQG